MRVNLAAQVFSRTVAAGIYIQATLGLLPQEAVHTAEFIYKIDQLYDCFNSATMYCTIIKKFEGRLVTVHVT